ncbi:MAG TPA: response regulator [Paludibaculum sp.]|jgi:twitching motility two-component system response regulator PilG
MAEATWVTPQLALSEAITAAKLGQLALARKLLADLVSREPKSEQAWLWVAALTEDRNVAYEALNRVLDINPNNRQAMNALALARLQESAVQSGLPVRPTPEGQRRQSAGAAPALDPRAPAQAVEDPAAVSWTCPLCATPSGQAARRCPTCKAIVGLVALEEYAANKGVNEELLLGTVQVLEKRLAVEDSLERRVNLALLYLNMNRSAEALPHLRGAAQMRGATPLLGRLTETLAARKLIVAIDDSLTVRKIVSITLERMGYRVMTALEGKCGIELVARERPDLILLDITMPGMDGYQVCKAIKQNQATKRIPVVMLSGKDGFFDKVKGRLAGATDYITKPFREATLAEAVKKYSART